MEYKTFDMNRQSKSVQLRPHPHSNFTEYSKFLKSAAGAQFGQLASFLTNGKNEYEIPPEVEEPKPILHPDLSNPLLSATRVTRSTSAASTVLSEASSATATDVVRRWSIIPYPSENSYYVDERGEPTSTDRQKGVQTRYQELIKIRTSNIAAMESKRPNMYHFMLLTISKASINVLSGHANWERLQSSMCPLTLWNTIIATHRLDTSSDPVEDSYRAYRRFEDNFKQEPNQSTEDFYYRYLEQLETLKLHGRTLEKEGDDILTFRSKLRNSDDFILFLDNAKLIDNEFKIKSLQHIFEMALKYERLNGDNRTGDNRTSKVSNSTKPAEIEEIETTTVFNASKPQKPSSTGQKKDEKKSSEPIPPPAPCKHCQGNHWNKDCPQRKKNTKKSNLAILPIAISLGATSTASSDDSIVFDPGAQFSIFKNINLLKNITNCDTHILGVAGEEMSKQIGDTEHFGPAIYLKNCPSNLLSHNCTVKDYKLEFNDQNQTYTLIRRNDPSIKFSFTRQDDGLYVSNFKLKHLTVPSLFATQRQNEQGYTSHELAKMKEVTELKELFGHPPKGVMLDLLKAGTINNINVTEVDIKNEERVYGKDPQTLQGRSNRPGPSISNVNLERGHVTMHCDIMFIEGITFLLSVVKPYGITLITYLRSKHLLVLRHALYAQIAAVSAKFNVVEISTDGENVMKALTPHINNIRITHDVKGPNRHESIVERRIQYIQKVASSIINGLPFTAPKMIKRYCVLHAVFISNLFPCDVDGDRRSCREIMTGRRPDVKIDLRAPFGSYLQSQIPYPGKSPLDPRTVASICLGSTGNRTGTIYVYVLDTKRVQTKDVFTVIPMPDNIITQLNNISKSEAPTSNEPSLADPDSHVTPTLVIEDMEPEQEEFSQPIPLPFPAMPPLPVINPIPAEHLTTQSISTPQQAIQDEPAPEFTEPAISTAPLASTEISEPHVPADQAKTHPMTTRKHGTPRWMSQHMVFRSPRWLKAFHITVNRAMKSYPKEAKEAIFAEFRNLDELGVFEMIKPGTKLGSKPIPCSLFLTEKMTPEGVFELLKARLVGGGDHQIREMFGDVSSPTVSSTSIMLLLAIAAKEGRTVATADIKAAYLNANMDSEIVYMTINPQLSQMYLELYPNLKPFLNANNTLTVRLKKALYGCIQSAKLWYQHISKSLIAMGYTVSNEDSCLFHRNVNNVATSIAVHVDDLLIASQSEAEVERVKVELEEVYRGGVKFHTGDKLAYLGMSLDFSTPGQVTLGMPKLIKETLTDNQNFINLTSAEGKSPANSELFVIHKSELLHEEVRKQFHSCVAKLLYLARFIRPDILTAVIFLSSRVTVATHDDLNKLSRVLKYLSKTTDQKFTLRPDNIEDLTVYADASYGTHNNHKSHTGFLIKLGTQNAISAPIHFRSSKQKLTATSSTEAEIIALAEAVKSTIWIRNLLIELGYKIRPTRVLQDNKSTITVSNNGKFNSKKTKHIGVRYQFIKDEIDNSTVILDYCPTKLMVADALTKPLQGEQFNFTKNQLIGA
jgi:hypothetical protein